MALMDRKNNWWLPGIPPGERKIFFICLGIALFFWLIVKLSQTFRTERGVAFSVRLPDDLSLVEAPPEDMRIQIEGQGWDLLFGYFRMTPVRLTFDLVENPVPSLLLDAPRLRSMLNDRLQPSDLEVTQLINYNSLLLEVDEKVSRLVPIQLRAQVQFAREYQLSGPLGIAPDSVRLTGPASRIDTLAFWPTDSLSLKQLKESYRGDLSLLHPPRVIQLEPESVEVEVPVEEYTEKSVFVPVTILNSRDSLSVFPAAIRINFIVGLSQYNKIISEDFLVQTNMKGAGPDDPNNTRPIELKEYPEGIRNIQFAPANVQYYIFRDSLATPLDSLLSNE